MKSKYYFIKSRLAQLGKTQREMAQFLGIESSYLNITINKNRELQAREIAPAAKYLEYDLESFTQYVSGEISNYNLIKEEITTSEKDKCHSIPKEDLKILAEILEKWLIKHKKRPEISKIIDYAYFIYDDVKVAPKEQWESKVVWIADFIEKAKAINE